MPVAQACQVVVCECVSSSASGGVCECVRCVSCVSVSLQVSGGVCECVRCVRCVSESLQVSGGVSECVRCVRCVSESLQVCQVVRVSVSDVSVCQVKSTYASLSLSYVVQVFIFSILNTSRRVKACRIRSREAGFRV